jgi:hypothetical protein
VTPLFAIQSAVYAKLNASPLLAGKVFDFVPEGTDFPYVTVGEAADSPDNRLAERGWASLITVHVWTRAHGYSASLAMAREVFALLDHTPLNVSGFHHVATRYTSAQTLTDPEPPGDIRHVVVSFNIITEE